MFGSSVYSKFNPNPYSQPSKAFEVRGRCDQAAVLRVLRYARPVPRAGPPFPPSPPIAYLTVRIVTCLFDFDLRVLSILIRQQFKNLFHAVFFCKAKSR